MVAKTPRFRLFYHRASSASLRATIFLACRGVPADMDELDSTRCKTDHRGIPVLLAADGRKMTLARLWNSMLAEPRVHALLEEAGSMVQPFVFNAERFEVHVAGDAQ